MPPFEENAAILRNIAAKGGDLSVPRSVDFSHVFPDQPSAQAFAGKAQQKGFSTSVEFIEDMERQVEPWDVTASKEMIPTCENITDTEEGLDALARSHRGRADGWGFFSN